MTQRDPEEPSEPRTGDAAREETAGAAETPEPTQGPGASRRPQGPEEPARGTVEGQPARRAQGLGADEVAARVARGEVNDVPAVSSRSVTDIVRSNVFTRFNAIIGVLFLIILVVGPVQDGLFGFVIVANTLIGIVQELRAKKTLDGLAVIGEARPTVRREGRSVPLHTDEIVLGDLIELGPGDKAVVDGEVVESADLEIDESLLTGEADPVLKRPGDPVMSGSFVVAGGGAFTATRVGREAYAARLTEEASRFTLVRSELRSGINVILKYVTWMIAPVAIGLVLSQLVVEHNDIDEAVRRMIGGIVPMVPEGLVLLTSIAFAVGVVRLGRRRCLVQELPAIEGLARVDVVCLDKTGTLTEGGMAVKEVRLLEGARAGSAARGTSSLQYVGQVLTGLGAADPRPNASMRAIVEAGVAGSESRGWRTVQTVPFSSARKYSGATFVEPDGRRSTWRLGAPDVLLPPGHPALGDVDALNAQGLRVLLLAACPGGPEGDRGDVGASGDSGDGVATTRDDGRDGVAQRIEGAGGGVAGTAGASRDGVASAKDDGRDGGDTVAPAEHDAGGDGVATVPTALVVLEQRLRPDAGDTLRYFAEEDVAAKVLSGDNAVSVGAVAERLGLPGAHTPVDARHLSDDRAVMARELAGGTVFGRVSPQRKRDMVAALQADGHQVAMTGDGVNDVLALKDADIGVAMGSGAEATRAVAQIVLLDDSFATLPSVVAEGRRVIGNIERVASLFLVKTVYSVLLALLVIIWRVPYPFLPRHLTLLSTLTIGVPAFFLALAPNRERARPHFVHRVLRYSVPAGVIAGAATFATYLAARGHYTGPHALEAETSVATLTLFLISMWVLAIVARPYTWWRVVLVLAMGVGFVAVLATPWLQDFFALRLVGTSMPVTAVCVSVAASALLEYAWRWVGRHYASPATRSPAD